MERDGRDGKPVLDVVRKVLQPTPAVKEAGAETTPIPAVERVQPAGEDGEKAGLERQVELMGRQMQQMQQRIRELEGTEGEKRKEEKGVVRVDVENCSGCGSCVDVCPNEAIELVSGTAVIEEETCSGCGVCVDECPNEALTLG